MIDYCSNPWWSLSDTMLLYCYWYLWVGIIFLVIIIAWGRKNHETR